MYHFTGTGLSDRGRNRQNNEDRFAIDQSLGLFVLCDGVGGHNSGEVASALCVKSVVSALRRERATIERYQQLSSAEERAAQRKEITRLLGNVLQEANEAICALSIQGEPTEGLATTAEVLLVLSDYAILGHVGDSRTYILRANNVYQLSMDHKFGVEMIKNGTWDKSMAATSPFANTLTRAIGAQEVVQPDILEIEITKDDLFLICSDGFSDYFGPQDIQRLVTDADPASLPKTLIDAANQKGGKDNITTLVIKIIERGTAQTKRIDVLLKQQSLGKVPLFCYMSFAEISKILAIASARILKKGEVLFKENDPANEMFVIVSGTAQVRKGSQLLVQLQHGASIGEMGILDQSLRSATITAGEDTTLLEIPRSALMRLLQKDHNIAVKFLWAMSQELDRRLRTTSQSLMEARKLIAEKRSRDDLPFVCDELHIKTF